MSGLPLSAINAPDDLKSALVDLYVAGTPENTLRAYSRDMVYITAWRQARLGAAPIWPETAETALTFVLDHAVDLSDVDDGDRAHRTAAALIAAGLRKSLRAPAPATLDRRIASWRAMHRLRGLESPFDAPIVQAARTKARRAQSRRAKPKSSNPVTRAVLQDLVATCGTDLRGLRDRALLTLAWASGGRRRSEIAGLRCDDLDRSAFAEAGTIRLRPILTKTTSAETTPVLILKGSAAAALDTWLDAAGLSGGPVFRAISRADRVLGRGLSADGVRHIVSSRLVAAGYPANYASAHGLRSGFLTQAALDGVPIQAAMRLSLHRSVRQAMAYYDDVDIAGNPATDLLDRDS